VVWCLFVRFVVLWWCGVCWFDLVCCWIRRGVSFCFDLLVSVVWFDLSVFVSVGCEFSDQ